MSQMKEKIDFNWDAEVRGWGWGGGVLPCIVWVGVCCWVHESAILYKSKFCKIWDPVHQSKNAQYVLDFNLLSLQFLST